MTNPEETQTDWSVKFNANVTGKFMDPVFEETYPNDMTLGITGCEGDTSPQPSLPELKRFALVIGIDGLTLKALEEAHTPTLD